MRRLFDHTSNVLKYAIGLAILVPISGLSATPQSLGDSSASGFAPHHLNDMWVYYVRNGAGDDTLSVRIIAESTDTQAHWIIRNALSTRNTLDPPTDYWFEYQMIDSAGNVFFAETPTAWRMQFKAGAKLGDGWRTGFENDTAFVHQVSNTTVFSVPTTLVDIGHKAGSEIYAEDYAAGFGLVSRTGAYAIAGELYLIAASIGGIIYGDSTLTGLHEHLGQRRPAICQLFQNYPNPFNPSTTIKFELPRTSHVTLSVYDILGRQVSVLVNGRREAGVYEVGFDGSNHASGVYFYRIVAGSFTETKRLLLIR